MTLSQVLSVTTTMSKSQLCQIFLDIVQCSDVDPDPDPDPDSESGSRGIKSLIKRREKQSLTNKIFNFAGNYMFQF